MDKINKARTIALVDTTDVKNGYLVASGFAFVTALMLTQVYVIWADMVAQGWLAHQAFAVSPMGMVGIVIAVSLGLSAIIFNGSEPLRQKIAVFAFSSIWASAAVVSAILVLSAPIVDMRF